jgi:hypothetical protein
VRTATVSASSLSGFGRLDSGYFLSPGFLAAERLKLAKARGLSTVTLGGAEGIGRVWAPQRFKRVYAVAAESAVPYLRPYDVFDYLPLPADLLSESRTRRLDTYRVTPGMILQTCSGRNLGPGIVVDSYLARFAMSHDIIRVEIDDETLRCYVLAFLNTQTGQELVKRDKGGSVIDHISVAHVEAQEIPLLDAETRASVAVAMRRAQVLREEARLTIDQALTSYDSVLPQPPRRLVSRKVGWPTVAAGLGSRMDAAPRDPLLEAVRSALLDVGGVRLGSVAKVLKPHGRYKTYYVDAAHGRPILSGAQVLQLYPINLRHISPRTFKDVEPYRLQKHWTVLQADGRAEEGLGIPAMVTPDREGWLASGHVGRLAPLDDIHPGWLYLAMRTWHVQAQLKALACGSVVDALYPQDIAGVVLPPPSTRNADAITDAWDKFALAQEIQNGAVREIEFGLIAI